MPQTWKDRFLLRRIGRHFRNQDWFVVAVEFVIVAFGVFLGLQASNWNDERQERRDELLILERLHDETGSLLEAVRDEREQLRSRAIRLGSAAHTIFSLEPARPLTQDECAAIAVSHVYRMASDELPILDELVATGRFDRLRDDETKRLLRSYILFRDRQRANHEERTNELFRLYSRHPETISVLLLPKEEAYQEAWAVLTTGDYRWSGRCDIASMRSSQSFKNEFFDNVARNSSVLEIYDTRERMLVELEQRLAELSP